MTKITIQDGRIVLRDGKVGTESACCCVLCKCDACPETLGFTVTFYGVKNGPLTLSHPHTSPGGVGSSAACDQYPNGLVISLGLTEDEAIPFGFSNVANVSVTIACGPLSGVPDGEWYINVSGTVANVNDEQVLYGYEGLSSKCDTEGYAIVDTDDLASVQCLNLATGLAETPCPIRVVITIA